MQTKTTKGNNSMKMDRFMAVWQQAQDLTFGEMREVLNAAEQAATYKVLELRKANFKSRRRRGAVKPQP